MSIQQNINQSIGTVAGALAMKEHLKQQEVSNELKKIDAYDKAITDYKESGERAINNINEQQSIINDPGIDEEHKKEALQLNQLERNEINLRMKGQDRAWQLLGVNKEDLKGLNSPEDQQKIHNFKRGEYDLDVAQLRHQRTDKMVAASQPNGYGLNTKDLIEIRKKQMEGEYDGD